MTKAQPLSVCPIRHHVRSLSLTHFRNYHSQRIEVTERPVVLVGPNGAGKTNILEAISLLTPGRGLRRATLSEMDNLQDSAPWAVAAEIHGPQGWVSVGTGRDPEGEGDKRVVRIDGKAARGHGELSQVFAAIWLTPEMDTLFIEGGSARRKFLDRLVYSFDPDHASRVHAYEQAMRERNRLLQERGADPAWLSALEQKMAEQGVAIAVARRHAIENLANATVLAQDSFPKARLALTGAVETALAQGSALAAEEAFREILARERALDAQSGRTQSGIHRTQVEVWHMEKDLPAERCSTGEQKALLVSVILAQARAGALWHGSVPVLLLDEVATHLDSQRRGELFMALADSGAQVWLTGTDRNTFKGLTGQFLKIENGALAT